MAKLTRGIKSVGQIHVLLYPVQVLRDSGVHARVTRFSAFVTEGNDSNLKPTIVLTKHQRTAGISLKLLKSVSRDLGRLKRAAKGDVATHLTGILSAVSVTRAYEIFVDGLKIGAIAIVVSPDG